MCLLNPANPAIARQRDEVIRQLMDTDSPRYHERIHDAQAVMSELMLASHERKLHPSEQAADWPRDAHGRWMPQTVRMTDPNACRACNGTGEIVYDICADGQCSDVDQVYEPCPACAVSEPENCEPIGYDDYESGWPGSRLAS